MIAILVLLALRGVEIVLVGVAVFRSAGDKFVLGVVGGVARVGLVVAAAALAARNDGSIIVDFAGPATSALVLFVAHRRMKNIPAKEEELRSRPFGPWLAVAGIDAMFLAFALFGLLIAREP